MRMGLRLPVGGRRLGWVAVPEFDRWLPALTRRMKIALLVVVCLVAAAVVVYFLLFPRNTFISFSRPSGDTGLELAGGLVRIFP
jgi:hypothetical protein